MKELAERLIAELKEGQGSINELRLRLGCRKNDLVKTYKKLVREGTITQSKEGTKIVISLNGSERNISEAFDYLRNTHKLVQFHLQSIEDLKKDGKKLEYQNDAGIFMIHPKPKEHADKIIELIGFLNNISTSYQYLDDFGYDYGYSKNEIKKLHRECVVYTKKILRMLNKHVKYFYQSYVGSDVFCLQQRIKLDEYFRVHKLVNQTETRS